MWRFLLDKRSERTSGPSCHITRIYAIRNPNKLARLDEEAALSR